jgi:gliding motility-associated lipoprotein GldD
MKKSRWIVVVIVSLLCSCGGSQNPVPKPPTYLELNLPDRTYSHFEDSSCGYSFEKPNYFEMNKVKGSECNKDISFGKLNGTLHLSVIDMDTSLATYVNYAIDKVGEHKVKATAIMDTSIIRSEDNVYGTFFELQGNVASPFQFYVTDSTDRFYSGVVYFNSRPNYDSILPSLNFVKKDLLHFMSTINW